MPYDDQLIEDESELYGDFCDCCMPDCSICNDDEDYDDNPEYICGVCLEREAVTLGKCSMCYELNPRSI